MSNVASDTRENLISAAMQLMLRHGYSATGIDSICGEARVSKGAFYHSFRSKEELAIAALESFFQRGLEDLQAIDVRDAPAVERLPLFVERLADRADALWENGCLLGGLASEMALANDELQRQVARHFDALAALLTPLAEPYAAAVPMLGVTARSLAEDLLAFVEGAVVLARGHRNPGLLRPAVLRFAALLRAPLGTPSVPLSQTRQD
ncbi:MAG: TetR/AcrR family transcriptional regulator [Vicinamibacterales bacterium]